jgi:hypothetical protein
MPGYRLKASAPGAALDRVQSAQLKTTHSSVMRTDGIAHDEGFHLCEELAFPNFAAGFRLTMESGQQTSAALPPRFQRCLYSLDLEANHAN